MNTEWVCESESPVCAGLTAAVGKDENAYYLYLMAPPEQGANVLRILWLCNRRPAPETMTAEGTGSILMPRENVKHDPAGIELDDGSLKIGWYATGDSPIVCDSQGVLGAIPPFAGLHDFPGFSRYVNGMHRYGWQMRPEDEESVKYYLKSANDQWRLTLNEDGWNVVDNAFKQVYQVFAGQPEHYLCLDQNTFPHKRLWMGKKNDICYDFSVGMSQAELPGAQLLFGREYQQYSRMELGFACLEQYKKLAEFMPPVFDMLMRMPWEERDFLGHGHTIDFDRIGGFASLLLVDPSQVPGLASPVMPSFLGTAPRFHWIIPITEAETAFVRENSIEMLLKRSWMAELMHVFDGSPKFLVK